MGLWLLLSILNFCCEYSIILCHNIRTELNIHIPMLMRSNLHRFRKNLKFHLIINLLIRRSFLQLEVYLTCDFIPVEDLEFFGYPLGVLAWDQSTEVKDLVFDGKYVGIDHVQHLIIRKRRYNYLLLKDNIIIISNYSWHTALCKNLKQIPFRIVYWVSIVHIDEELLPVDLGAACLKFDCYFLGEACFYFDLFGIDLPLVEGEGILV